MPGIAASTSETCAVRLGAERRRSAGKQLGVGGDLRMDLKADHDLPLAGCALDAIVNRVSANTSLIPDMTARSVSATNTLSSLLSARSILLTTISPVVP
jgi:hypothetical protein